MTDSFDSSLSSLPADNASSGLPEPAEDTLAAALARESLELPPAQVEALERYCRELWSVNESLNLTRHTEFAKFVSRDVVDSLAFSAVLEPGERVLDVGTGGGVPGVFLAITRPDLQVDLCESVGKKAKAVAQITRAIGLTTPVHHCRAEDVLAQRRFESLLARAVAPLPKLLTWFKPYWGAFDRLLAIKGPAWVEERRESRERGLLNGLRLRKLSTWPLPGTHSESVLLEIQAEDD